MLSNNPIASFYQLEDERRLVFLCRQPIRRNSLLASLLCFFPPSLVTTDGETREKAPIGEKQLHPQPSHSPHTHLR